MAKFQPQKRKFSDNPLVELPGACFKFSRPAAKARMQALLLEDY
jgi:hypothetical protein